MIFKEKMIFKKIIILTLMLTTSFFSIFLLFNNQNNNFNVEPTHNSSNVQQSNTFGQIQNSNHISSLNGAAAKDIKDHSATITVNVVGSGESNSEIDNYSLEIIDAQQKVVGTSFGINLNTSGQQEFTLSNLKPGTSYGKVKVRVLGKDIVSNEFSLSTPLRKISSLENASIVHYEGHTSVLIIVDALSPPVTSTNVVDFSLEIIDNKDNIVGKSTSETFNTDGRKTFNVEELTPGKHYGQVRVRVVGEKVVSNKFYLKVKNHIIDGISIARIDHSIPVTDNTFYIDLTTLINSDDSIEDTFKRYDIVVTADYDSLVDSTILTLTNQTDYKKAFSLKINGLKRGTTFSNIRVKILDSETKKLLGNEFLIGEDVTTLTNDEFDIDNIKINNSTSDGFNFSIEVSKDSVINTVPYKVDVLANDNTSIWTSDEQIKDGEEIDLSVIGLSSDTVYNNLKFQLINPEDYNEKYSSVFETDINIFPTNSSAHMVQDSAKIIDVKRESISFSLSTMNSSNNQNKYCSPYKIGVFANGYNDNPIWTSDIKIQSGDDILFTINNIKPSTKLNDVRISFVDINTNERIGNFDELGNISMPLISKESIYILSFTLSIILIITASFFTKWYVNKYKKIKCK